MSHRPFDADSSDKTPRDASARVVRAHALDVEADRPRWIDQYLDYFGEGGPAEKRDPHREPPAAGDERPREAV